MRRARPAPAPRLTIVINDKLRIAHIDKRNWSILKFRGTWLPTKYYHTLDEALSAVLHEQLALHLDPLEVQELKGLRWQLAEHFERAREELERVRFEFLLKVGEAGVGDDDE